MKGYSFQQVFRRCSKEGNACVGLRLLLVLVALLAVVGTASVSKVPSRSSITMTRTKAMAMMGILGRHRRGTMLLPLHWAIFVPSFTSASSVLSKIAATQNRGRRWKHGTSESSSLHKHMTFRDHSLSPYYVFNMAHFRGGSQSGFLHQEQVRRRSTRKQTENEGDTTTNDEKTNTLARAHRKVSRRVRQGAGAMFSLVGFVSSSLVSFTTDRRSFQDRFVEPIQALSNFLKTSGVDDELSRSLNHRLGINLCLLGRVHMYQAAEESQQKKVQRPRFFMAGLTSPPSTTVNPSFLEEARRYMRYATAVYGQAMINAAEVDARGRLDGKVGRVTKETISSHIHVPAEDIVLLDVSNLSGNSHHLRHMVVVDHQHKKVVLSIRGTFSLEEIVVDVAAFSREFCGGEAHSEMANMAERVWTVAGPKIKDVLSRNEGYEFILTGHSLGAGAACLLNILLHNKNILPKEQGIRCFAYASPPVFTPLEFVPNAIRSTTNFVNENDVVPFLSIQKVRKLLTSLRAVDEYAQSHMLAKDRYKVVLGASPVPKELVASVLEAEGTRLVPKKGAPNLYIPAEVTVLLKENQDEEAGVGSYSYDLTNAREMSQREIRVYPDMLVDHFPSRYEHAFDHLVHGKGEEDSCNN